MKAIKKAYAKKLRATRPDDDPGGFMELRQALEQAQNYAAYKTRKSEPESGLKDGDHEDRESSTIIAVKPKEPSDLQRGANKKKNEILEKTPTNVDNDANVQVEGARGVLNDIKILMRDPFGRSDVIRWKALINDPRLESIDEMIDFEDGFRSYLLGAFGYFDDDPAKSNLQRNPRIMTSRVSLYIFSAMGWHAPQGRPFYVQDQIDWLRQDLAVLKDAPTPIVDNPVYEDADQIGSKNIWILAVIMFGLFAIARAINTGMDKIIS